MKIKVASYNILHCEDYRKEKIDFEAFAEVIKGLDADVIGLNEVHGEGEDEEYTEQAKILGELTGYNYFFAKATDIDGNNPFGNAVLTRLPVKEFSVIPIPDPENPSGPYLYETRCILKMVTATDPEVTFLITHFGLNDDEHEQAIKTFCENYTDKKCILIGDLNVRPESPVIAEIKKYMNDTAEPFGKPFLTFIAHEPNRKIDYIFASDDITPLSFDVPEIILADHRPVVAELEI